ncbi:MAG: radical SAM protein [Candidatus Kuenenia sp.]|nr:radical SAM protein [Candidatus Kuenenia hertensis]
MLINEIFRSIQGETTFAGLPFVFVRLTGCNMRCSYCDTQYAYDEGNEMPIPSVIEKVDSFGLKSVCVTGGEPLANSNTPLLIRELLNKDYTVLVETNGSYDISILPQAAIKIMDIKCPGSDMNHKMLWGNISYLKKNDEVKFVLSSRNDYEWARTMIDKYRLEDVANILMSAVYGTIQPSLIASWILEDRLNVRLQLQLHKYIWGPEARGV